MGNSREAAFQRFCECIILFALKVIFARFKLKFYILHFPLYYSVKALLTNPLRRSTQGNMRHWIEDADCRDQYSVIYEAGERTAIFNNDAKDPITSEERAVSSGSLGEMLQLASPLLT